MTNTDDTSSGSQHVSTATIRPTLEELKPLRASSKGSITRIKNVVSLNDNLSTIELECRLEMLDTYYKQASYYQTEIEKHTPADSGRSEIDESYIAARIAILTRLQTQREPQQLNNSTFYMPHQQHKKLPNLRLPKFEGSYLDYKNFINSFNNLVHNDGNIPIIEKFNHLLSCLSGEALSTVKSFQVTEVNYPKALARLKERYDNDTLIFFENISAIFNVERATKAEPAQLRNIVDTISALYNSLKSLGTHEEICDAVMIHLVISKLDNDTKRKWDEYLDYSKLPKWAECTAMLDKRCQQLDASCRRSMNSSSTQSQAQQVSGKSKRHAMVTKTDSEKFCNFCSDAGHYMTVCQPFINLEADFRLAEVTQRQLCINCLSKKHVVSQCTSKHVCRVCKQRHHSLLHSSFSNQTSTSMQGSLHPSNTATSLVAVQQEATPTSSTTLAVHSPSPSSSTVLLATAVILIQDSSGVYHLARALLDSCSQVNIICENLHRALHLKRFSADTDISGVGSTSFSVTYATNAVIHSRLNNFKMVLEFLIAPRITGYHPDGKIAHLKLPQHIQLADPEFQVPREVNILLGAECFFAALQSGKIVQTNLPTIVQTSFGWIATGKCTMSKPSHAAHSLCATNHDLQELNENVERFWKIDEIQTKRKLTIEHEQCESHFKNSVALISGRIMLRLPFKADPTLLGNSRDVALRRFLALERKLNNNADLRHSYNNFMREYEDLGHMTLWPDPNLSEAHYFIPHHCVHKLSSETTKLRVVFDASCQTASQYSLNDILMVGPTVQNDLAITLLRFRYHQYGLMADVTKMFRQVLINPQDRKFQLILWRYDKTQPVGTYMLSTVTYGTASAPFLAIRSLRYTAEAFPLPHKLGKHVIMNDFYVDDMVTGADDLATLQQIQSEVIEILDNFKFSLSKWHCSHPDLDSTSSREIKIDENVTAALGVTWHPDMDIFVFSFQPKPHSEITKRTLLSLVSSLFDPLGLVSPIIIRARILLQHLWREKYNWDEQVPDNIRNHWADIANDLQKLQIIKFPRFARTTNCIEVQFHGFSDASQQAYGCCLYLRCSDSFGNVAVNLLMARARVAPLKIRTLPRLELCAAHLLATIWNQIKSSFSFQITKCFYWTDSQITLHWIRSESSTLTTFVGNRVAEIQDFTDIESWRHVPTESNSADLTSRGCSVMHLQTSIWLNGPPFLLQAIDCWPPNFYGYKEEDEDYLTGKRKSTFLCEVTENPYLLSKINSFSKYNNCIRVFARMLQLAQKKPATCITAAEMQIALLRIMAIIQQHRFAADIKQLKGNKQITSHLIALTPFLDDTQPLQLLRVGGRLAQADIPYDAKFPLLLPKDEPFVKVIVRQFHQTNYHAGPRALVALIQQQFWILNCKSLATQVVRECIHCTHYKPKLLTQIMGNLPKHRVTLTRPFNTTGVDFAGPVPTYLRIRGKVPYKTYIAVFVCFSTKAVHLEAVTDLSSDAFIAALKRFIGRRGVPSKIYCDNATNFVGADTKLKEFRHNFLQAHNIEAVTAYCAHQQIEFSFIPPRAPHFGGLWEAAVKSVKSHLFRTLPNARLTLEELMTALVEIEAIMNSRPLVAASTNPNDFEPLTPAHMLTGFGLKALPEPSNTTKEISHLQRWQRITAIKAHFWKRWHLEYLAELQNRHRWQKHNDNPQVNDMVVIHDDNLPPMKWTIGRITKVVLGQDARARVVDVKTPTTELRRPITKIAILPIN